MSNKQEDNTHTAWPPPRSSRPKSKEKLRNHSNPKAQPSRLTWRTCKINWGFIHYFRWSWPVESNPSTQAPFFYSGIFVRIYLNWLDIKTGLTSAALPNLLSCKMIVWGTSVVSNALLEKFPQKFSSLCPDALKHNPVYFVPLLGQDVSLLFFFSKRPTKNNILVRSSLTQVSLFALWPPHLIPGGAGCFFGIPVAPDGWLSLLRKKGRSHYCRHFFFFFWQSAGFSFPPRKTWTFSPLYHWVQDFNPVKRDWTISA